MAKLTVARAGAGVRVYALDDQDSFTIGRDASSDIPVPDPAVSRRHALIHRRHGFFILEDQNSTNGTVVNGKRVDKHQLSTGDRIHLGVHVLRFDDDLDKTVVIRPTHAPQPAAPAADKPAAGKQEMQAYVRYMRGDQQGSTQLVSKALFTLGKPGGQLAVISKRPPNYFLLHLGGPAASLVNGREVHGRGVKLADGDTIQVGDTLVKFVLEPVA